MKSREGLLVEFRSKLQKIINNYHNLYVKSDVDKKDFLKVSVHPLHEEIARLTAITVNEQLMEDDMIFDKDFMMEVTTISLDAAVDFFKNIKEKN